LAKRDGREDGINSMKLDKGLCGLMGYGFSEDLKSAFLSTYGYEN